MVSEETRKVDFKTCGISSLLDRVGQSFASDRGGSECPRGEGRSSGGEGGSDDGHCGGCGCVVVLVEVLERELQGKNGMEIVDRAEQNAQTTTTSTEQRNDVCNDVNG